MVIGRSGRHHREHDISVGRRLRCSIPPAIDSNVGQKPTHASAPRRDPGTYSCGTSTVNCPSQSMTIRVLIADDHEIVRHGLRTLLELDPELEVVGQAADGAEAVRMAARDRP